MIVTEWFPRDNQAEPLNYYRHREQASELTEWASAAGASDVSVAFHPLVTPMAVTWHHVVQADVPDVAAFRAAANRLRELCPV